MGRIRAFVTTDATAPNGDESSVTTTVLMSPSRIWDPFTIYVKTLKIEFVVAGTFALMCYVLV